MNLYLRFPQNRLKALTLSYDDGVFQDIRLMKILDKYGIKCTFNLNSSAFGEIDAKGRGKLSLKQVKELYTNSSHEVAVHTSTHPHLEYLPLPIALNEVLEDRKKIEKTFDVIVRGMAYPFGTYNDALIEGLKNLGIAYSRTVISTEKFEIPTDWLRLPATCHHKNPRLNELCDNFLKANNPEKAQLFYLWGHSYEFDDNNNWDVIESFCEKMGNREDIWYATNIEIYDYIEAYNRLIFSVDTKKVYNPNAIPVWFAYSHPDGIKYAKVNPAETLQF